MAKQKGENPRRVRVVLGAGSGRARVEKFFVRVAEC